MVLVDVVEAFQDNAEAHLCHSHQHCQLHLEAVLLGDLAVRVAPDGVHAKRIHTAVIWTCIDIVL